LITSPEGTATNFLSFESSSFSYCVAKDVEKKSKTAKHNEIINLLISGSLKLHYISVKGVTCKFAMGIVMTKYIEFKITIGRVF